MKSLMIMTEIERDEKFEINDSDKESSINCENNSSVVNTFCENNIYDSNDNVKCYKI